MKSLFAGDDDCQAFVPSGRHHVARGDASRKRKLSSSDDVLGKRVCCRSELSLCSEVVTADHTPSIEIAVQPEKVNAWQQLR